MWGSYNYGTRNAPQTVLIGVEVINGVFTGKKSIQSSSST